MDDYEFDSTAEHVVMHMHRCVRGSYNGTVMVYRWNKETGEKTVLISGDLKHVAISDDDGQPAVRALTATVFGALVFYGEWLRTHPLS